MKHDDFGDRMKQLESTYTSMRVLHPDVLCVRIDGKKFSKYTKGFTKPFDDRILDAMSDTAKFLVEKTNATISYTQSDEITLIFVPTGNEYIFGGKVSKINSILASMATARFNQYMHSNELVADEKLALFDCRSWAVPSVAEASNTLLWRIQDCRKNSVSCLYRWTAGHSRMKDKNQNEMIADLLVNFNTSWDSLSSYYKYGTIFKRIPTEVETPYGSAIRTKIQKIDPTDFTTVYSFQERANFINEIERKEDG